MTSDKRPDPRPGDTSASGGPKIILPGGSDPKDIDTKDTAKPGAENRLTEKHADESWKEKARREKEKLAEAESQAAPPREMPPASFLGLIEDLAVRTMFALGQIRDPATGETYVDLETAKYSIDLLGILEQKTKGNLDATEASTLKDLLHNLRLAFVQISRTVAAAMTQQGIAGAPDLGGAAGPKAAGKQGPEGPDKPKPKIII